MGNNNKKPFLFKGKKYELEDIKDDFGKFPKRIYKEFSLNKIKDYHEFRKSRGEIKREIDDITWNDLDMDEVFKRINYTSTPFGEGYLYTKLREVNYDKAYIDDIEGLMKGLKEDEEGRTYLKYILKGLGHNDDTKFYDVIFNPENTKIKNFFLYAFLSFMFTLSIVISFIYPPLGLIMLAIFFCTNVLAYNSAKVYMENKFDNIKYISSSFKYGEKINTVTFKGGEEFQRELSKCLKTFKSVKRLTGSISTVGGGTDADILFDYVKMLFMIDILTYQKTLSIISNNQQEFVKLFDLIGKIDFALSTVYLRESLPVYSLPEFTEDEDIEVNNLFHVLIDDPVTNSFYMEDNAIITGSNASGKSTFIKAFAINVILSQSLNTSCSTFYSGKYSYVVSSMAIRDNIMGGESYFIKEINSLKRLLNEVNDEIRILAFVDEILRGTNTLERIAASSSILKWMCKENMKVMVASHDIELTQILEGLYDNYHFSESVTSEGISFDYKINDGRSETRNAIKLLEFLGYDKNIVDNAEELSKNFLKNKSWC